jgi:tRNA A-37 threonylcarbamoyl transferase component Bud32
VKTIEIDQLQKLIDSGKILEEDGFGVKVVRLTDDRYLKIFNHRPGMSMGKIFSRAKQFANNAKKLKQRGIITVGILELFRTKNPTRDCVIYHGVPGETVRDALKQNPKDPEFSKQLGAYIAQLHDAGVMFRSLHFGNIVQLPDGELGLIDIADMRVNVFQLNMWQRKRNVLHVFRYAKDIESIELEKFVEGYSCTPKNIVFTHEDILNILSSQTSR